MIRALVIALLFSACSTEPVADAPVANAAMEWRVVDTDFSKGRLGNEQAVSFDDLVTFHGHWCDGLVVGAVGLGEALHTLYPSAPIDRTDLRIISRSSPCLTDVAVMLTGARAQFGTFQVSDTIPALYIVQRISDGKTVSVALRPEVKPERVDSLGRLAVQQLLSPCGLDSLQAIEEHFGKDLLAMDPKEAFIISEIPAFTWPAASGPTFTKTDILNKNAPRCASSTQRP
ncbi:MAG: formylmethanofuran dehydrogenase subunit E family protein [Flavobacteriales bacterium]|nr:formylmethanofuran dehydrogenase subunit E family protein [Flavobacteriales bacterium]MBK6894037.1 formylmethanofuran dehydrogenase subunit E family protein [Flavobacteriales bacterium]